MSEGPEVKRISDTLNSVLKGKKIENILFKNLDEQIKDKIIDSKLDYVKAYGKNLVFKFSSDIYLRNHMLMWGKWRIYERLKYDNGLAIPPPRRSEKNKSNITSRIKKEKDVRNDSRSRLVIITKEFVLVEFNGPILEFSIYNPVEKEPIKSLGPDCLNQCKFQYDEFRKIFLLNLKQKEKLLISEVLLNQRIIAGIGNKYKSEILFRCRINPFKQVGQINIKEKDLLIKEIVKLLEYGYKNDGRTRELLRGEKKSWNTKHWVFRRTGKMCWICNTEIKAEKTITSRTTFWCPSCQK